MSHTLVIKTKPLKTSRLRRALIKTSITWDHPCYLFIYNYTYTSHAYFHLIDLSKIIDDCYLDSLLPTRYAFGVDVLVLDIIHDLVR